MSVAGFIAAQRAQHGIPHATACRALGVSPAWFYKWRHGDASPRRARRAQLAAQIGGCSPRTAAATARRGSPPSCARRAGGSARTPSRRSWPSRVCGPGRNTGGGATPARAGAGGGHRTWSGASSAATALNAEVVRRRHRDRHRRGQAVPGQRAGHGLAADRRVRPVGAPRRRAGLRGAGDGGRGPRRPGGDRRGDLAHRSGQRVHRRSVPDRLRAGWGSASRWAGPGRRWTTRSSSPGTPPWSSSCAGSSSSPPGPQARAGVAAWIEDYNRDRRHSALGMAAPIDYELGA